MSETQKTPAQIASEDPRNTAVDLDIDSAGHGTGFYLGDGIVITASHNGENEDGTANDFSRMNLTMARSSHTSDRTDRVGRGDFEDAGDYAGDPFKTSSTVGANNHDVAVIRSDLKSDLRSSLIVFENPNDASGNIETLGFPSVDGSSTDDGSTPYYSAGTLSKNSMSDRFEYDTLVSDKDVTGKPGMDAIGGQSGSAVQLDYDLVSSDTRLGHLDLDNHVVGVVAHGSRDGSGISRTASSRGVGIEEFDAKTYNRIGDIAEQAARDNSDAERYVAREEEVKAAGGRWNRAAKDAAEVAIDNTPVSDQIIADRFAQNVMVSNQSVSNEDAVVRNADTAQPTPDFNGAMFNEINYANQNVSMNYDMKGGFDTADYFVVGAGKGLDVQIGKDTVTVEKSFTTREQVAQDVVTDGVTSQQMVTQLKAHTATDTWRNTEGINGTGSDDNFNISDLSGIRNIDGRDLPAKADGTAHAENDTLTLDPSMGPVSWHFNRDEAGNIDRKNGYVTNGTDRVDFKNIETVATRDGDIVDGVRQGVAPAPDPALDATPGAMQSSKTVTESLAAVDGEFSDVQALIAARAAAGTLTVEDAQLGKLLSHSGTPQLFANLDAAGIVHIFIPPHDVADPLARMRAHIEGASRATRDADMDFPESHYLVAQDATGVSNAELTRAAEIGGTAGDAALRETLTRDAPTPTQSNAVEAEVEYDTVA